MFPYLDIYRLLRTLLLLLFKNHDGSFLTTWQAQRSCSALLGLSVVTLTCQFFGKQKSEQRGFPSIRPWRKKGPVLISDLYVETTFPTLFRGTLGGVHG